ncbi:helix-turn-helix domain-containing protein [Rugamonas sp. FT103W]|uniref:Helix-turn-helix domain-containing protein n=1 Tax=Rugamonas rivuli TaxID=2743358 RepID=A0A843SQP2_9BURK|nr:helix-turn-helix domain-containing protein [Rugamonas rivuli]
MFRVKTGSKGHTGRFGKGGLLTNYRRAKKTGLTPTEFAELLGISVRTLEDWEQGHRQPEGAARTLLAIALDNPDALLAAKARNDEAMLK